MTTSLLSKLKTHLCTLTTLILLGSQAFIPSKAQAQYQTPFCEAPCDDTCAPGCGLKVYADLLFWSDFYQNIYARDRGTNVGEGFAIGRGRTVPVRLDPGFRIGVEYPLGCTGWNVFASYLWFYSGLEDSFSARSTTRPAGSITPAVGIATFSDFLNASAKLSNQVNHFELAARKDFCIGRSVLWRPYTGIAVAALKEKKNYEFSTPGATAGIVFSTTRSRASAWGIGPSAGAEFEWGYCEQWGIIGKASGAALIGNNVYSERNIAIGTPPGNGLNTERFASVGLYWQASIGFISHLCFCGYNFDLGLECDTSRWTFKNNRLRTAGLTIKSGYAF